MTNEQLIRQYYDGDEAALEKLYHKNIGLIRGIAKEAAAEFNCLMVDEHHPNQFSAYTKTILDDLCGEGALEFLTRIQSREYDESRAHHLSLPAFEGAHDPLAGTEYWLHGTEQGRDVCRPTGAEAVSCCMEGYQ